jgi:hypothetical protein
LGIDISVLSWTKKKKQKKKLRETPQNVASERNVHGLVGLFVPDDPLFADPLVWPQTGLKLTLGHFALIGHGIFCRRMLVS